MSKPRKLPSGKWQIRFFTVDGERASESFATFELARTALRNREQKTVADQLHRERYGSEATTVAEAAVTYFDGLRRDPNNTERRFKQLVARHRTNYETHIEPHLGEKKLSDLTPKVLRGWTDTLAATKTARHLEKNLDGRTLSASRIRAISTTLRQIAKANDVPLAILLGPSLKQKKRRKKPRALQSLADVNAFLAACRDMWFRVAAAIACHTGARLGEVASLRWHNVNATSSITLETSWDGPLKARYEDDDEARVVPIGADVVALLAAWREITRGGANDHVVLVNGKRPMREGHDDMAQKTRSACKRAGLTPLTFHQLRHTYGTIASMQGLPLSSLQALLGHADAQTTSIYINAEATTAALDPRARLSGNVVATSPSESASRLN